MGMTEEGLSRLRGMESQAYYFYDLLDEIENGEDILPQEYQYLDNANEFFDTILFGAGDLNARLRDDTSMSLNDFFIVFNYAKRVLEETKSIKSIEDLNSEFDSFKRIISSLTKAHEIPTESPEKETFDKLKVFFKKYSNILSNSLDFVTVEI